MPKPPTHFVEANALLAMQAAQESSAPDLTDVDKALAAMSPIERELLARACTELAWYARDFTRSQTRSAANS